MGVVIVILVVVGIGVFIGVMRHMDAERRRRERLAYIRSKYPDPEVAENLIRGVIWQGETAEQLVDSLGRPAAVDRKVLKTKTREVWKYGQVSARTFRLRVTIEDDHVVGWDQKG